MSQMPVNEYRSKLSIFEDEASILVEGGTFRYFFDKKTGLISHLEVLGDDFLAGTNSQIPDIYISSDIDPRRAFYAARYEDQAECDVVSANPYEIHIRTHGKYHSPSGEIFPVRYRITYEIQSDGTIFVIVHNKAYERCIIRWLCISRSLLNSDLCKYFSHLADQSRTDTTDNYIFKDLPSADVKDQTLFSGRLIPWFWLGNDQKGVEVCIWDVTHHRYGATRVSGKLIDPLGNVGANVSCVRQAAGPHSGILCEIFSLRNLLTPVKEGWEQINYFTLSPTPTRLYSDSDLRVYSDGFCQSNEYKYLSDDEIKSLSRMGYNLIIGAFNWRCGEFIPDNEPEVKRVVATCHKYGVKIVPCIPLMDLNENTPIFQDHGSEWRIEPVVENEYQTSLMCPGAEEWREYWKQQIDRLTEEYDFDGAYFDFWYDKLACRNPGHGCQRRYMRPTFVWVREMLSYASAKFKAKNSDSMIIANTDILPISLICSWLDARSVGVSQDIRHINRMTGKAFYSSYRLGCNSLMRTDRIPVIDHQVISLSLLYMAPLILSRERSREELLEKVPSKFAPIPAYAGIPKLEEANLVFLYWNVLRFFGVSEAKWYPGFIDDPETSVAETNNPDVYINVHKRSALLLTLVNLAPDEVRARVSLTNPKELGLQNGKSYLVYEPVSQKFLAKLWTCDDLSSIKVSIPGHNPLMLYIREAAECPVLLFALGADRVLRELWDKDKHILEIQLSAPAGADVSIAIYSASRKPARITSEGKEIEFTWDDNQGLAILYVQTEVTNTTVLNCIFDVKSESLCG